jgi:beta-lactamase class A
MRNLLVFILSIFLINISAIASTEKLAELEAASGGRLGLSVFNTANDQPIQYRDNERFPLGSTFKVMVVAAVLKQSMLQTDLMQQKIMYQQKDIETWSPITEKNIKEGMTIFDLCAATISYSDNTAANLLINKLGGPQAITAFARSIGDQDFSMDSPGDFNITSTPRAMNESLQKITMGNILGKSQREQLITWMKNNTTGDNRIRAGVPKGWTVADKTGSGDFGVTNDIGIIWPPNAAPIIISIYFIQPQKDAMRRPDVIAEVTRISLQN